MADNVDMADRDLRPFDHRSILVTGASSGLGAAAVRRFAAGGGQVFAASRD